jgi:dephospho-CoA kinase
MSGKGVVIGITGGMGSGKSTAAGFFEELGFLNLDSDQIIREDVLLRPEIVAAIRAHFGEGVLNGRGAISRPALARVVFSNDDARIWLEDLLHPRVIQAWQGHTTARPDANWVIETPLLYERGLQKWFDFIVCVASSGDLQVSRLELRGVSKDHSRPRIARQLPLAQKIAAADFVLLNDGSREFLKEQVVWLAGRWD